MADERVAAVVPLTTRCHSVGTSRLRLSQRGEEHEWVKELTCLGHPYWYNTITKVSQWHDLNPASGRAGHAAQQASAR